jgi:plant 3beta-hydroxysteroid-4alpha-carboxylate 3-dehydrogenase
VLGLGDTEDVLDDALRDGRAVYASADVCNLDQLIQGDEDI